MYRYKGRCQCILRRSYQLAQINDMGLHYSVVYIMTNYETFSVMVNSVYVHTQFVNIVSISKTGRSESLATQP